MLCAAQTTPQRLSENSTESVPDSLWHCSDFLVGAGVVILQPTTGKVVVINDKTWDTQWFLPKGRKDVGESIEETALREAYEESGYRVQFLPLATPTRAPKPSVPAHQIAHVESSTPQSSHIAPRLNTEPVFISTYAYDSYVDGKIDSSIEYITFWYAAFIGPDAVPEEGTGVEFEENFQTHLFSLEEAMEKLTEAGGATQAHVVKVVYDLWLETEKLKTGAL